MDFSLSLKYVEYTNCVSQTKCLKQQKARCITRTTHLHCKVREYFFIKKWQVSLRYKRLESIFAYTGRMGRIWFKNAWIPKSWE